MKITIRHGHIPLDSVTFSINCSQPGKLDNYPSLTYTCKVFTFVETPLFTRLVSEYLSDNEYLKLQVALSENPEAGVIIPNSGGIRKLRWSIGGRGKRGGLRVIYYLRSRQGVIWMLTLYPKNVAENIPAHVLRQIRKELEDDE